MDAIDEKVAHIARLQADRIAASRAAVERCIRRFNDHQPLPYGVDVLGQPVETSAFLRGLNLDGAMAASPASPSLQRDIPGAQSSQLGGQAQVLYDTAVAEGLLDRAADAPEDLSGERALHRHVLTRGNTVPSVTVERAKPDPEAAARDALEAASAAEDRRRLDEVQGIRARKARGLFDQAAFHDQTGGVPAQRA